ncbi:hypothetical protein KI387_030132, partial [Taxus chinensis]
SWDIWDKSTRKTRTGRFGCKLVHFGRVWRKFVSWDSPGNLSQRDARDAKIAEGAEEPIKHRHV